jgi:hypothetical protein
MWILLKQGLTVKVTDDDAERFCLSVASGQIKSADEVIIWLADRLAPIS